MVQVIANRPRDCLACRIVSGCGLLGISLYVTYQARAMKKNKSSMFFVASGALDVKMHLQTKHPDEFQTINKVAAVLGTARLFNLPPFNKSSTE
ncbi:uncharacterized protein LOC126175079 [Schistocerca cancellata]|uniref:uncharacterized protein LOC126175079 n=1 Tax=Schistocerca cancellata TaxID=274614 RepID=UPI00211774EC|nr:uncharacterized protein LOC126175079 [Schistocerca cancellata]